MHNVKKWKFKCSALNFSLYSGGRINQIESPVSLQSSLGHYSNISYYYHCKLTVTKVYVTNILRISFTSHLLPDIFLLHLDFVPVAMHFILELCERFRILTGHVSRSVTSSDWQSPAGEPSRPTRCVASARDLCDGITRI
jgi:hypothetical protein